MDADCPPSLDSSTHTRTPSLPEIVVTSFVVAWPAQPMPRSRRRVAESSQRSRATRRASEDELIASTRTRLDEMLACGTTTAEVKSGYGLDVETELKMLRALRPSSARRIRSRLCRPSWARTRFPSTIADRRDDYVRLVIDRMIPAVASDGLAEWCDVFCETGVFSPDESRAILEAGARHGLKPRIHADELGPSGGSIVAADVGARSADHLIFVPAAESRGWQPPASSPPFCRLRRCI